MSNPNYKGSTSDYTRDYVTPSDTTGTNDIQKAINNGRAALEQTPHQAQPTCVRIRDFRFPGATVQQGLNT